jgi:hypothetical protein
VLGDPAQGRALVLIGDSHLQQWWPRLERLLGVPDGPPRPVILITAGGTPALPGVNQTAPGHACDRFFDFALGEARKPEVSTVVFGCRWEGYFLGGFPGGAPADLYRVDDPTRTPLRAGTPATERVFADFGRTIADLVERGKEVYVILSAPSHRDWDPLVSSRLQGAAGAAPELPRITRAQFEAFLAPVKRPLVEAVVAGKGTPLDPLDDFETGGFLEGRARDGRFLFRDSNHLRPFHVRERAAFLDLLFRRP